MLTRSLQHLRQNLIAYLALFVALGGTSYAVVTISGTQIRNHTITAVKLDPRSIAGSVKAWVNLQVDGAGKVFARSSSSPMRIQTLTDGETISWKRVRLGARCIPVVTPERGGGHASEVIVSFSPDSNVLDIFGSSDSGTVGPVPAAVAMICP